jgi:hypothetical protein
MWKRVKILLNARVCYKKQFVFISLLIPMKNENMKKMYALLIAERNANIIEMYISFMI